MKGETSVISNSQIITSNNPSICVIENYSYRFVDVVEGSHNMLSITLTFDNNNILDSIGLKYQAFVKDNDNVDMIKTNYQMQLEKSLGSDELNPNMLNPSFYNNKDSIIFSLYLNKANLNKNTIKYFTIEDVNSFTKTKIISYLENNNFKCTDS